MDKTLGIMQLAISNCYNMYKKHGLHTKATLQLLTGWLCVMTRKGIEPLFQP